MKDLIMGLAYVMAVIAIITAVSFGGYYTYAHFAPRYEQVRMNTFKESQAYNDGMLRELSNMRLQWATADATKQAALRAAITQQYSAYDRSKLPTDLREFLSTVEAN